MKKQLKDKNNTLSKAFTSKKISVLGTEYTIYWFHPEDFPKQESDGCCCISTKQILVEHKDDRVGEFSDPSYIENEVIRHELIHAFFYESGCEDYYNDERLVTFLGIQWKKISKLIEENDITWDDIAEEDD